MKTINKQATKRKHSTKPRRKKAVEAEYDHDHLLIDTSTDYLDLGFGTTLYAETSTARHRLKPDQAAYVQMFDDSYLTGYVSEFDDLLLLENRFGELEKALLMKDVVRIGRIIGIWEGENLISGVINQYE